MNIILIGLGPHAKRIYLRLIKKYNLTLSCIVDLESNREKIEKEYNDIKFIGIKDNERDYKELSIMSKEIIKKAIDEYNITHAIISSEPKSHLAFSKFLLSCNLSILMDKPITSPVNVISDLKQSIKIGEEYKELKEEYLKVKEKNPKVIFSINCQRRFHKGYKFIKNILEEITKKYRIPITYIDIYHNDGMWNMPDELIYRENHPYKYGYGKLFHSGYHFIDLLTWILEVNKNIIEKDYNKISIYSTAYTPKDYIGNIRKREFNKLFNTNKLDKLISEVDYNGYGELDIHSIINFFDQEKIRTTAVLNLMQSGFSRRSWINLPIDTYKSNGRVRHERINIHVGPLMNIQIHSYQAYEVKDRESHGGDAPGDIENFDIYIFRNSDLIGGKPFEKIKLSEIVKKTNQFIGYNEMAREECFKQFIEGRENDSDILLHDESIMLTEKIYESIIEGGKQIMVENLIDKVTEEDFNIEIEERVKKTFYDEKNNKLIVRYGARGIVFDENNNIALIFKKNKNEYKLPGGGVEKNEDFAEAFKRECNEEIACNIEIKDMLGIIEEHKINNNFKQISKVYVGKVINKLENNELTEKEKEEGLEFLWVDINEALKKMKECLGKLKESKYDDIYRTKFMVMRDIKILEYYLKNKKN